MAVKRVGRFCGAARYHIGPLVSVSHATTLAATQISDCNFSRIRLVETFDGLLFIKFRMTSVLEKYMQLQRIAATLKEADGHQYTFQY